MNRNPISWFEIYVGDMDRARRFYESVFQVALTRLESPNPGLEMWSFPSNMEGYGASGALAKMEGCAPGGNSTLVYFSCEDVAVEEGRVAAAGGRVQQGKMGIGEYGFIALLADSEGNLVGLHSMK
jgi:uncharacterized protein